MDAVGLVGRDAALGIDLAHVVEQGNVSWVTRAPASSSRLTAKASAAATVFVQAVERQSLGNAEAQTASAIGSSGKISSPAITASDRGTIGDATTDRAHGIERGAQRKRTVGRHPLPARLEADQAAKRRRDTHRATRIGADRDVAHTICDA